MGTHFVIMNILYSLINVCMKTATVNMVSRITGLATIVPPINVCMKTATVDMVYRITGLATIVPPINVHV